MNRNISKTAAITQSVCKSLESSRC